MKRKTGVWQRAMYLTSKPSFKDDVIEAREANNLPPRGFASPDELEQWRESHVYNKSNGNDIEEAIDLSVAQIIAKPEYGLSPGWHHSVKQYLFLNNVDDMDLPIGLESRFEYDALTGRPRVLVVVDEGITEDDYKDHWQRIEKWRQREQLEPQRRQREAGQDNLRRGKLAYELWAEEMSYPEIAEKLMQEFGGVYTADDVRTTIRNFMKQAGI